MNKKKSIKVLGLLKEYRAGILVVGSFVFGVPLIVNGIKYFTEILPKNPLLLVVSIIGTLIAGIICQFIINKMFEK